MNRGPNTPEGIAAVTRNLPPPDRSGPKTAQGKLISSMNSLKHGLAAEGFLRCRKEACHFHAICWWRYTSEGRELMDEMPYGASCILEGLQYKDVVEALEDEGIGDAAWRHLWAMNEVRMMRRRMMATVNNEKMDQGNYESMDLTLRYNTMLRCERQRLLAMLDLVEDEPEGKCSHS